jgi:hypothetical protein
MPSSTEEDVYDALRALDEDSKAYLRTISEIPQSTLKRQLLNWKTRSQSYEKEQLLNSAQESRLVDYVSRASKLGSPTSLPLLLELAKEIRLNRALTPSILPDLNLIFRRWTDFDYRVSYAFYRLAKIRRR